MRPARRVKPKPLPLTAAALRSVERRGLSRHGMRDLYHALMTMPMLAFLGVLAGFFIVINVIFAGLYFELGGLGGVDRGRFSDAFFFSVQTFSTTGYGAIYPVTLKSNIASTIEIVIGLLANALATGMLFARLSRPKARVLFSNVIIIRNLGGAPALMFRVVNERRNQIVEARMSVTITRDETDEHGSVLRRMISLPLEREVSPIFALSWLVTHRITEGSPLMGKNLAAMADSGNVIICSFSGIDDTLNANIYARHVYGAEHIRFGHRFVDVIERRENGDLTIDYRRFHDTIVENIS